MAVSCAICGKIKQVGNQVSHAHNKTKRLFKPNLQKVWAWIDQAARRIRVCTSCIRSGRVVKPLASQKLL